MSCCEEYWQLLNARLDGELSPDDAARLERHLSGCPLCRQSAEDLEVLQAAMRDLPVVAAPAGFKDNIMAAVAADNVLPFAPARTPWKKYLSTAAALAVIIGGALLFRGGPDFLHQASAPTDTAVPTTEPTAPSREDPTQTALYSYEPFTDTITSAAGVAPEDGVTTVFTSAGIHDYSAASDAQAAAKNSAAEAAPSASKETATAINGAAEPESVPALRGDALPAATFRSLASPSVPISVESDTGAAPSPASVPLVTAGAIPRPDAADVETEEAAVEDASIDETAQTVYDAPLPTPAAPGGGAGAKKESITSRQALELVVDHVNAVNASPLTNVYTEDESVLSCTNSLSGTNAVVNTVVYEGLTQDGAYYLFSVEVPNQAADRYQVSLDGGEVLSAAP